MTLGGVTGTYATRGPIGGRSVRNLPLLNWPPLNYVRVSTGCRGMRSSLIESARDGPVNRTGPVSAPRPSMAGRGSRGGRPYPGHPYACSGLPLVVPAPPHPARRRDRAAAAPPPPPPPPPP